jgi:aminopeptidase N
VWQATGAPSGAYQPDAAQAGQRALRYAVLPYLLRTNPVEGDALARLEFATVQHMTGQMGLLTALAQTGLPFRDEALNAFHARAACDPLLVDKWFMLQAQCRSGAEIAALTFHADFTFSVPNRVHALLSTFMSANMAGFHASDGTGYQVIADAILTADQINPQLAARLATGLRSWRMFDAESRAHAEPHIMRVLQQPGLSRDCYEIISRIAAAS